MLLIAFIILLVIMLVYYFLQKEHARGKRKSADGGFNMTTQSQSKNALNDFNNAMMTKPFGRGNMFSMFG